MKGTMQPSASEQSAAEPEELARRDAWWRAANHLSVVQICLLVHWRTTPKSMEVLRRGESETIARTVA